MRKMKNRTFTLIGLLIVMVYIFFIQPYPETFPTLTQPYIWPVLIAVVGLFAYVDGKRYKKD